MKSLDRRFLNRHVEKFLRKGEALFLEVLCNEHECVENVISYTYSAKGKVRKACVSFNIVYLFPYR